MLLFVAIVVVAVVVVVGVWNRLVWSWYGWVVGMVIVVGSPEVRSPVQTTLVQACNRSESGTAPPKVMLYLSKLLTNVLYASKRTFLSNPIKHHPSSQNHRNRMHTRSYVRSFVR